MLSLTRCWYQGSRFSMISGLLLPLSWLFRLIVAIRRQLYRAHLLSAQRFSAPIVVVGNITVGGTGKTPLVIWLAQFLRSQGYRPGIVSRGYGGKKGSKPYWVKPGDAAVLVGDEAILLAKHAECPVVIGRDRVAAVRELLQQSHCNVVISDDGLQHYRLHRDIEIVVVDGARRFGNARMLPAGPLRERVTRLQEVDFVIVNGGGDDDPLSMAVEPSQFTSLSHSETMDWTAFPRQRIHAVAGVGHPERFFTMLQQAGFDVIPHAFPDHYRYKAGDLDFTDSFPIIMTEKDAVKCTSFADQRYWCVGITVKIRDEFKGKLLQKLKSLEVNDDSEADFNRRSCGITHGVQRHITSERS